MAAGIKKGDVVVVIAGDDDGKSGKVLRVDHKKDRVVVEGIRVQKIARKAAQTKGQGGIIEKECPIHISNVMVKTRFDQRQKNKKK